MAAPVEKGVEEEKTPEQRFLEYKNRSSAKHPLYTTETQELGKIPIGAKAELEPPKWGKGKGESFSKTFIEPYKYSGLDVSATKHRFLKELDGTGR